VFWRSQSKTAATDKTPQPVVALHTPDASMNPNAETAMTSTNSNAAAALAAATLRVHPHPWAISIATRLSGSFIRPESGEEHVACGELTVQMRHEVDPSGNVVDVHEDIFSPESLASRSRDQPAVPIE
jgi:hypothetical protein